MTDWQSVARGVHIVLGFSGFVLGAAAILSPKFGAGSNRHRWVGRAYAVCMLGMALVSLPLSLVESDYFLLIIGLLTLGWVVVGWRALRTYVKPAAERGGRSKASLLRIHVTSMGSSYIGAWTAFLVNVEPFGSGGLLPAFYWIAPSIIGSVLIARTTSRFGAGARAPNGAS